MHNNPHFSLNITTKISSNIWPQFFSSHKFGCCLHFWETSLDQQKCRVYRYEAHLGTEANVKTNDFIFFYYCAVLFLLISKGYVIWKWFWWRNIFIHLLFYIVSLVNQQPQIQNGRQWWNGWWNVKCLTWKSPLKLYIALHLIYSTNGEHFWLQSTLQYIFYMCSTAAIPSI